MKSIKSFKGAALASALAVTSVVSLFVAKPSLAGWHYKSQTRLDGSSVSVSLVNDADADGVISYGDTIGIKLSSSTLSQYGCATLNLSCSQNGALVLTATSGLCALDLNTYVYDVRLSSGAYQGGAADCTASASGMVTSSRIVTFAISPFQIEH